MVDGVSFSDLRVNKLIYYMHFKKNFFEKTAELVFQKCYLTKIDLKDA